MAALVVNVASARETEASRIAIFPGAATTSVYRADTPFWVGYGFLAEPGSELGDATRFELDVDSRRASMSTERTSEAGRPVGTTDLATFPEGLPAGWHDFTGRWYEEGRLILSARTAVEFVES